jgi:enamine deaminase RidA (YjgF/YER057c/UK114 family)
MYENVAAVITAAGGQPDHILKLTVLIRSRDLRSSVNEGWTELFPEASSRPARQVLINEALPPQTLLQCDFLAVIPDSGG